MNGWEVNGAFKIVQFPHNKTVGEIPTAIRKNDYQKRGNHKFSMVKRW